MDEKQFPSSDSMTTPEMISTFLIRRPGERFTAHELADALDRPLGTVGPTVGKLHADRMRSTDSNPAGVYAFSPTIDCRFITYAYHSDRPLESDLHPVPAHAYSSWSEKDAKKKQRREMKAKAKAKATCTLTPTAIDGVYLTGVGELVRLVHVEIVDR
jgi:hypothetical protein